jgi:hypothetical protein
LCWRFGAIGLLALAWLAVGRVRRAQARVAFAATRVNDRIVAVRGGWWCEALAFRRTRQVAGVVAVALAVRSAVGHGVGVAGYGGRGIVDAAARRHVCRKPKRARSSIASRTCWRGASCAGKRSAFARERRNKVS